MTQPEYIKKSFLSALGTFAYISAVALFLSNAENIFFGEETILIPMFMLLLFVISATITGLLVLLKPVQLYIDGFKKEAVILLLSTVGWLIVFLVLVAAALALQ